MPPRSKMGELPKPRIQAGVLGCQPLNAPSVSLVDSGHADLIIGFRDAVETLALRQRGNLQIKSGSQRHALSLEGRLFNGYSDALYRGHLPEVLLVFPSAERMDVFYKGWLDYLAQILGMGFFVPKKYATPRDPVEDFIPCTVLCGPGLLFSQFVTGLMQGLKELAQRHPGLSDSLQLKLLGQFVRGLPGEEDWAVPLAHEPIMGSMVLKAPFPQRIRIAGGSAEAQWRIQQNLAAHGLTIALEQPSRNAVERLELENALWRLSSVVLPSLAQQKQMTKTEMQQWIPLLEKSVLAIAQERRIEGWTANAALHTKPVRPVAGQKSVVGRASAIANALTREDWALVSELAHYADALNLPQEKALFQQLAARVGDCFVPVQAE